MLRPRRRQCAITSTDHQRLGAKIPQSQAGAVDCRRHAEGQNDSYPKAKTHRCGKSPSHQASPRQQAVAAQRRGGIRTVTTAAQTTQQGLELTENCSSDVVNEVRSAYSGCAIPAGFGNVSSVSWKKAMQSRRYVTRNRHSRNEPSRSRSVRVAAGQISNQSTNPTACSAIRNCRGRNRRPFPPFHYRSGLGPLAFVIIGRQRLSRGVAGRLMTSIGNRRDKRLDLKTGETSPGEAYSACARAGVFPCHSTQIFEPNTAQTRLKSRCLKP